MYLRTFLVKVIVNLNPLRVKWQQVSRTLNMSLHFDLGISPLKHHLNTLVIKWANIYLEGCLLEYFFVIWIIGKMLSKDTMRHLWLFI